MAFAVYPDGQSPFAIDLVAEGNILASTPFNLEPERLAFADRTFTKFVRIAKGTAFDVLIQFPWNHLHKERHPQDDAFSKWLVATVRRCIDGKTLKEIQRVMVPDDEKKHILLSSASFITWNDRSGYYSFEADARLSNNYTDQNSCTRLGSVIGGSCRNQNKIEDNIHQEPPGAVCDDRPSSESKHHNRPPQNHYDQGVTKYRKVPALFSKYERDAFPHRHEIVVCLHRARHPSVPSPDDVLVNEFRLYCMEKDEFKAHMKQFEMGRSIKSTIAGSLESY